MKGDELQKNTFLSLFQQSKYKLKDLTAKSINQISQSKYTCFSCFNDLLVHNFMSVML